MGPDIFLTTNQKGCATIPIHNLLEHTVTLAAGTRVGKYEMAMVEQMQLTEDGMQLSSSQRKSKHFKPITKKERKVEYLRQLVDNAKKTMPKAPVIDVARAFLWLENTFKVRQQPCVKEEKDLQAAVNLLERHWDLYPHDGTYWHTHLLQQCIITEDVPPIKCCYQPINPVLEPAL